MKALRVIRWLTPTHMLLLALPALLASVSAASPAPAGRPYLASIQGVKIGPDEFVSAFSVDTWGVTYRAVCHFPPGWFVKAGRTAAPDGSFEGQGTNSVSYLNRERLRELNGLVLITLNSPVRPREVSTPQTTTPPTFDGTLTIGSFGTSRERRIKIGAANVRLVPSNRCPAN